MISSQSLYRSTLAMLGAGALLASAMSAQASMLPNVGRQTSLVHKVDCAVGAHIGPLGACILGSSDAPPPVVVEQPAPVVVERRAVEVPADPADANGCATKSVTRTDGMGNSETKTKTNC